MARVAIPRSIDLHGLRVDDNLTIAEAIRVELVLRDWRETDLAKKASVTRSSLSNYLRGRRSFPEATLAAVLGALRAAGPFRLPALNEVHVIPTLAKPPGTTVTGQEREGRPFPDGHPFIDTVWLDIDVAPELQEAVEGALRGRDVRSVPWGHRARRSARAVGTPGAVVIVAHRAVGDRAEGWLVVQAKLSDEKQRHSFDAVLQRIRRVGVGMGDVRVSRLDLAVDYPVSPAWLAARRLRSRRYEWRCDADGATTIAIGKRGRGHRYVRIYDAAARHGLEGLRTRIEAEVNLAPAVAVKALREFENPFRDLWVGDLTAPDLTAEEVSVFHLWRSDPAVARTLRGEARRWLSSAVEKCRNAKRISPERDVDLMLPYLQPWFQLQFIGPDDGAPTRGDLFRDVERPADRGWAASL